MRAPGHDPSPLHASRGLLIFAAALMILPVMDAIAKRLSARLPVLEIIWARYVVYSAVVVPAALVRHGLAGLRPRHLGGQALRGTCMALAAWSFFQAVSRMPVPDAMAIFLVYPAILLVIARVLLGERPTGRQWLLVTCGFAGALLVVRPSFGGLADGSVQALGSALFYALGMIATRRLADEPSPFVTTALSALVGAVGFSAAVPAVWTMPLPSELPWLAALGTIAAIGHFGIVLAHRHARSSQLAPLGYTEIASAVVVGAVMFGTLPDLPTWAGIALIVASGVAASWPSRR